MTMTPTRTTPTRTPPTRSPRRAVLTVAVSAALLAACSSDANPGAFDDDPTSPERTSETTEPAPEPTPPASDRPDTNPADTNPADTAPPVTSPVRPQGFAAGGLEFFGDCEALLTYLQDESSRRVTPWGLGYDYGYPRSGRLTDTTEAATDDAASAEAAPGALDPDGYSGTNTQEVGVDEGDIVETDGEWVYVASPDALRVIGVDDVEVAAVRSLPQGSHQMLLAGDRLLVATLQWSGSADTIVSSFDVSDPTAPELLRRSHLEGALVATRAVDGVARLVIETQLDRRLPFVTPDQFGLDDDAAIERNKEIIAESSVEDWLPRWFDEATDGGFEDMAPILDCGDVAAPSDFAGLGVTWIASVDMSGDSTPVGSAGIVSTGQTVYASADHLYVATQNWEWWNPLVGDARQVPAPQGPPPTAIHQFTLGPDTGATYVASGTVDGRLIGQYAMSEHDGDLRVATTVDGEFDANGNSSSESMVTVLRPDGEALREISRIGGLGRGEQIYAVRFLGDTGYVVTFRQIDPLYVLDLSDPANPVLQGELKIPGYSAYLHPVGDRLLLGVGQDATPDGVVTGTKLSLFDVSDPTAPTEIDALPIGGTSDVEWDPKAFLYWEPDGTIVLPVSPGWDSCGPAVDCLADGVSGPGGAAVVVDLDGRELSPRGVITHDVDRDQGCWNPLQRSIAIGDELVTIGLDRLQIADRETLVTRDGVGWGGGDQYACHWYYE
jgi:hypothetical protein